MKLSQYVEKYQLNYKKLNANFKLDKLKKVAGIFEHGHIKDLLFDLFFLTDPIKSRVNTNTVENTTYQPNLNYIYNNFLDTAFPSYGNKNIVFSSTKSDSLAKSYHSKLRRMDVVQSAYSKNTMNLNKLEKRNNLNAGNDDMIKKVYFDRKILKKRELRNTYLSDFYQNTMIDFLHSVAVGKKINNKKFNVGSFINNINKIADQAPTLSGYVTIEKQKHGSKDGYFLESNNMYNLKKKSFLNQYKEGMTHKNYLNKIKKDFINLTNSNSSTAIGNKENRSIKEGLEQVIITNKKPIQVAVNVSKFQDSINIHTHNLQESTTKIEEKVSQVFVKILKDAAKVGRQI